MKWELTGEASKPASSLHGDLMTSRRGQSHPGTCESRKCAGFPTKQIQEQFTWRLQKEKKKRDELL